MLWIAVELLSGPTNLRVSIWAKFVFTNMCCQTHYAIGGSAHFYEKKGTQNFEGLLSGPSWPFLVAPNLAQIITPT